MFLHRPTDVTDATVDTRSLNAAFQAFFSYRDQRLQLFRHRAHRQRHRRIADTSMQGKSHIERNNIALLRRLVSRKTVNDLLIDRRPYREREGHHPMRLITYTSRYRA